MTATPQAPNRETFRIGSALIPSLLTLGNLFAGLAALVQVFRGDFIFAGWLVVVAGTLDLLDGSVARFTKTGSRFGAELDSLVDAISFGVVPGFLVLRALLADLSWGWLICFLYVAATVLRLARFNVEQGGRRDRTICGLAAPLAGATLASGVLVRHTELFETLFSGERVYLFAAVGTLILAALMLSRVPYAKFPRIPRLSSWRIYNVVIAIGFAASLSILPHSLFLFLVGYVCRGLARAVFPGSPAISESAASITVEGSGLEPGSPLSGVSVT